MLLTDYFYSTHDATWDFAVQSGVRHGTIRLPEDPDFDITQRSHWETVYRRFTDFGIRPVVIEPMPNNLHDHIKEGDAQRDASIEKVIRMLELMSSFDIRTVCFNFMAHIGWLRTHNRIPERGGAFVTGFDEKSFVPPDDYEISEKQLWANYTYFLRVVIPYAEKYGVRLALHPDDPPLPKLGGVSRIMTSYKNIRHAVRDIVPSENLGVTMCQANFYIMGENLYKVIPDLADKIFFVHFRNTTGDVHCFRETFHDNGDLDMPDLIALYRRCGINVPIRVDHVPTMAGEDQKKAGYDSLGRLFAIGYLKGILEAEGCCDREGY